jgi:hypothetical protein
MFSRTMIAQLPGASSGSISPEWRFLVQSAKARVRFSLT